MKKIRLYIFLLHSNPMLHIFAVIMVLLSTFILHYTYGVYQNFHCGIPENNYIETDQNSIDFIVKEGKEITKRELDISIEQISSTTDKLVSFGNSNWTLLTAYANLDWNYPSEQECEIKLVIAPNCIKAPTLCFDGLKYSSCSDGGYWTDEQEQVGENVCLYPFCYGENYYYTDQNGIQYPDYSVALNEDGLPIINGQTYRIAGFWFNSFPLVCYSSLDDTVKMSKISFYFEEPITSKTYEYIYGVLQNTFGSDVIIPLNKVDERPDIHYSYGIILTIIGIISFLCAINCILLFHCLIKGQGPIFYKMPLPMILIYQIHMLILYCIANITYLYWLMPKLSNWFTRMQQAYNRRIIVILLMTYFIALIIVSLCYIFHLRLKNPVANEITPYRMGDIL